MKYLLLLFLLSPIYSQSTISNTKINSTIPLASNIYLKTPDTSLLQAEIVNDFTNVFVGCKGTCYSANMNFSYNSSFTSSYDNWTPSHGSPSVGPGYAWMWAGKGNGEGINYKATFDKYTEYCIEFTASHQTYDLTPPHQSTRINMILTPSAVKGTVVNGGGSLVPPTPIPNLTVFNFAATSLPQVVSPNTASYKSTIFTNSNSFKNVWIFPSNDKDPFFQINLRELRICKQDYDPCNFKIKIQSFTNCQRVQLFPLISFVSPGSLTVKGYIWKFGDGETSNDYSPIHFYSAGGTYNIT